jgi:cytochrome c5
MNKLALPTLLALTLSACGHKEETPPPAPATQSEAPTPVAPAPAAVAPAAGGPSTAAGDLGEHVFNTVCTACHGMGIAGAPKVGDKAAWAPRVAEGNDVLYKHALEGFTGKSGTMPPRGGHSELSDSDVKAAVDYMVSKAKG